MNTAAAVKPVFTPGKSLRCPKCGPDYSSTFWDSHFIVDGKLYCKS